MAERGIVARTDFKRDVTIQVTEAMAVAYTTLEPSSIAARLDEVIVQKVRFVPSYAEHSLVMASIPWRELASPNEACSALAATSDFTAATLGPVGT
jgi:hypothetical protein